MFYNLYLNDSSRLAVAGIYLGGAQRRRTATFYPLAPQEVS
jgi:hypothetical protein